MVVVVFTVDDLRLASDVSHKKAWPVAACVQLFVLASKHFRTLAE